MLPAAVTWAAVGALLNTLPLSDGAAIVLLAYSVYYGATETLGRRGLVPPGTRWQVPQRFVSARSRRQRLITWGALLGAGFATRNPYAGFGLLVLAVALPGDLQAGATLAVTVGALHGGGRAVALLRGCRRIESTDYAEVVLRFMYWRVADGLALLGIGGLGAVAVFSGSV